MNEKTIQDIAKQFTELQVTNYFITGLLMVVSILFGAVLWYFKTYVEETKAAININEKTGRENSDSILVALSEIKHNRQETDKVLRILAKHTGANIGL